MLRKKQFIKSDYGELFLTYIRDFCLSIGGNPLAFDRSLEESIRLCNDNSLKINKELLDAFFPDYQNNLYKYYVLQQYDILYRFLQYPFLDPTLAEYITPYNKGISKVGEVNVIEYGCGIPYGLIITLLSKPEKIKTITLIDLDLIHMDFVEFVIKRIAPTIDLRVHRLRDNNLFPELSGSYNFFFGKDIFEHLYSPEIKLKKLLSYSSEKAICYFDFNNKGQILHQHITPSLEYLFEVMRESKFVTGPNLFGLTEFSKNI
jgi:hypothetical protein